MQYNVKGVIIKVSSRIREERINLRGKGSDQESL